MGTVGDNRPDRLSSALFGKTRRSVLALLFGRAGEAFYLREIARASGAGLGAVQREVAQLEAAGIIRRSKRGNQVYYQADSACPVFPELRGLTQKTAGIADVLREALVPLTHRIRVAFIYGSAARGEAQTGSDVDVLVVGEATFADVVSALQPAQDRLAREVNPTVYPVAEFSDKLRHGHHFVSAVANGTKVLLIGDEHELGAVAQQRMDRRPSADGARNRRPARARLARPR